MPLFVLALLQMYLNIVLFTLKNKILTSLSLSELESKETATDEMLGVKEKNTVRDTCFQSPSLVTNVRVDTNSAVAEIIITENDDARGIVEFSSAAFNTTEPNAAGFLTVSRSAGRFGQVCFTCLHSLW